MKLYRRMALIILFLAYFTAAMIGSDRWGNIIAPAVDLTVLISIYLGYVRNQKKMIYRIVGGLICLGLLTWMLSDIAWAFLDVVYHIDPVDNFLISIGYAFTNLFFTAAFTIYGFSVFRKWNGVQILLDSTIITFCVINLVWVIFFNQDSRNFLKLQADWVSTASILMDVLIIIWVAIWYLSIRKGQIPRFLRLTSFGVLLYALVDLVYYYQYFYNRYNPNSILDALYITSFLLIAAGSELRIEYYKIHTKEAELSNYNIGRRMKGLLLMIAPILLLIFEGFEPYQLLLMMTAILVYFILSYYIQNNVYKEELLKKEKNQNILLEQMVKDRTEELLQKNNELERMLNTDDITGLYNRRYISRYLEETIRSLKENETILFLYIDINRFKMITNMFGHSIGDGILREMGEKLKTLELQEHRLVLSHYGQDIFVLAACGQYNYNHGLDIAKEAVRLCSDHYYEVDEFQIHVTTNVGVSIYPYDAHSPEELIMHADTAMSQAKMLGFNKTKAFDSKLSEIMFRKNNIELMLKRAVLDEEFQMYYQPQVNTITKQVTGFEALLRWNTPAGEFIMPAEFIPIAEETGYIVPIGAWVLHHALKQLAEWNRNNSTKYTMGINVSNKQLETDQFIKQLIREMDDFNLRPEWIDIEITETLQLQQNPEITNMLDNIRKLGVTISIDDFGTGYSTLSYLKKLSVDRIKIARELISHIHDDPFDRQLVKSLIEVARAREIRVIAEGVELKEQYETLKEMGCDEIQGYYFGRPLPVRDIEVAFLL